MKRLFLILLLAWGAGEVLAQGADPEMTADTAEEADSVAYPTDGTPVPVGKATPDALWDRANTAYLNGDYHAATSIYEEILSRMEEAIHKLDSRYYAVINIDKDYNS